MVKNDRSTLSSQEGNDLKDNALQDFVQVEGGSDGLVDALQHRLLALGIREKVISWLHAGLPY